MNYSGGYFPYDHPRNPAATFKNSPYPLYNPYHPPFLPPPQYPHFPYRTETATMTAHQDRIPNDNAFYDPLADLYKLANEPKLDHLLRSKTDSILEADPFSNSIGIDFGFGPLHSLADYKIEKTKIRYRDTFNMDDMYLFEAALLSDDLINDIEKLRRWNQRLKWENIAGIENKRECWSRMREFELSRIGISPGGWWANQLFGMSINSTYGYYRLLVGGGGILTSRPDVFRKGQIEAHYPLTGEAKVRFPFWRDGGLGLGRSLIAWVDDRPGSSGGTSSQDPNKTSGEGNKSTEAELVNRRLLAQRRMSDFINSIMESTMRIEPIFMPHRIPIPRYQQQAPLSQTGIRNYSEGVYPPHVRMPGYNLGNSYPYTCFSNYGTQTQKRSFTEPTIYRSHNPTTNPENPNSTVVKDPSNQPRLPKAASNHAAQKSSSCKKIVRLHEKTDCLASIKNIPSQNPQSASSYSGQNSAGSIPKRVASTGLPKPPEVHAPQRVQQELERLKLRKSRCSN